MGDIVCDVIKVCFSGLDFLELGFGEVNFERDMFV